MIKRLSLVASATLLVVAAVIALTGCGASARQHTITASLAALDTAADGFAAWDKGHQMVIVKASPTEDAKHASLAAYRERRAKVVTAFTAAYRALAAAAVLQDAASLSALAQAAQLAYAEVAALEKP